MRAQPATTLVLSHHAYGTVDEEYPLLGDTLQTEGSWPAALSYAITCPAQGCFACQTLEAFLTSTTLVPQFVTITAFAIIGATALYQQSRGVSESFRGNAGI